MMKKSENQRYADVILPVRLNGTATYIIPQTPDFAACDAGSRVVVELATKKYCGVVESVHDGTHGLKSDIVYKSILSLEPYPKVSLREIGYWKKIADYYLCTVGEVYKAAWPFSILRQQEVKSRKTPEQFFGQLGQQERENPLVSRMPDLSVAQNGVFAKIGEFFASAHKPVLLHGVAGSGKTEIYVSLAIKELEQGKNVLYMVPEIALSRALQSRLKKIFGERLLVFHSGQTVAERRRIHDILSYDSQEPVVVLGTRSALFLPYRNLGLVIVDEEHDSSYKQSEPAPRYHARDAAVILASEFGSNILMGSATPSLESEYNCSIGRFAKVELAEKYYGAQDAKVEIIDTVAVRKSGQMKGSFSQQLINEIRRTLERKKQVLVFKNRRSYSPLVECADCGDIPKCPHCNVVLSYHKYNGTLSCHYCDYTVKFNGKCKKCGSTSFNYPGAGTEKIEEELKILFPEASIARFDADITKSKRNAESVIKLFSQGATDILVGTQMIGKGFDFENLELVAILDAQLILGVQDFRADERALQLFSQLIGRAGRRNDRGKVLLQTNNKEHPVISFLKSYPAVRKLNTQSINKELFKERAEYKFAPFVRMIKLTVKNRNPQKLDAICETLSLRLDASHAGEISGPFVPAIEKIRGEWLKCFYIKLKRDKALLENKKTVKRIVDGLGVGGSSVIIDVDPY